MYTLLVGGLVIPGGHAPDATAIAWAEDVLLAVGTDDEVMAISRGDSHLVNVGGAVVVPLGEVGEPSWPVEAVLEVGGPASFALLDSDPRAGDFRVLALVRGGHVVRGALPPPVDWPARNPSG